MKLLMALILAIVATAPARAADTQPADSATAWLMLIDAGSYAQSWNEGSQLFQTRVTEAQWEADAKGARLPFGAVISRSTPGVTFASSLPGAPDGQYAVLKFPTQFAAKTSAVETVTMVMEGGAWKAAGYFIK